MPLPADVRDELLHIAADLTPDGFATDPFQRRPAVTERTRSLIADLHRHLAGGPGLVVLTGFPVEERPELTEAAYWVLGLLLGTPTRQNLVGDLIRSVENLGHDANQPGRQGYRLPEALPFHIDRWTDLIGLLCIRSARSGGISQIISCKHIHNLMLKHHPELLSVLYEPIPFGTMPLKTPEGVEPAGWCEIPVFSNIGGMFAAHYMRRFIEDSQSFDDAPRLRREQLAALDAVDELLERSDLPLEMVLRPGDVQLINNLYVLHSRTAYEDDDAEQGRLLLRMHLAFSGSPALPAGYAAAFGATAAGTYRGGAWRSDEIRQRLGTPIEPVGGRTVG